MNSRRPGCPPCLPVPPRGRAPSHVAPGCAQVARWPPRLHGATRLPLPPRSPAAVQNGDLGGGRPCVPWSCPTQGPQPPTAPWAPLPGTSQAPSLPSGLRLLPRFGTAPVRASVCPSIQPAIQHCERQPGSQGESADKAAQGGTRGTPPSPMLVFCCLAVTSACRPPPALPPQPYLPTGTSDTTRNVSVTSCWLLSTRENTGGGGCDLWKEWERRAGFAEPPAGRDAGSPSITGTFAPG